jgi:hypothetical protein
MKVELLVSEWCPTCPQAERVWREVAAERDFRFAVLDLAQVEGREVAQRLRIRTIPAVVVDGALAGVGVQSPDEARRLVAAAPARAKSGPLHAGILLSADNRWFIASAMIHLFASGIWMLAHGAMVTGGAAGVVGMHLFAVGFVLSLIYGLGAHMLPRFTGNPIRVGALPWLQLALLCAGLWTLAAGSWAGIAPIVAAGGGLLWVSFLIYAVRILPVLWPARAPQS